MKFNSGLLSQYLSLSDRTKDTSTPIQCDTQLFNVAQMATLNDGTSLLSSLTSAPGPLLSSAQGYVQQYAITGKNTAYYIFYAILLTVAVLYVIAYKMKSKCMMMALVSLSFILTLLLTLFYVVEWIVVTLFGDLCFDVSNNLVNTSPVGDIRELLRYYTQGIGSNPFQSPYDKVNNALTTIETGLNALISGNGACTSANDPYYGHIIDAISQVTKTKLDLTGINSAFDSAPFQKSYDQMVELGICDEGLAGMFVMWVCHIFLAWGISISMFAATLVWQYFEPEYWNLSKDNLYEKPPEQEIEAIPVGINHYADSGHVQMTITQQKHANAPKHDSMI